MTVLVLDDEKVLLRSLTRALKKMDQISDVMPLSSGDELVSQLDSMSPFPQLFVLDINMPGTHNGISCLEKIKEKSPDTKVYMLTSSQDDSEHALCRSKGAEDVVVKPMGSIALKAALKNIVSNALG